MQYNLKLGDQTLSVEVEKDAGTYTFTIGERSYTVEAHRFAHHHLYANIDGQNHHFYVHRTPSEKHVLHQAIPYVIEDASRQRKGSSAGAAENVTPPMPGSIIRVLVAEGDTITKGQELLIMSAMKMETTLHAPKDGIIKKVLVAEGDQVSPGQQLVEIEDLPPPE